MKLEGAYLQFTGMSRSALHTFSAESIISVFSASGEIDYNRIFIAGMLFKEEADVLFTIKDFQQAEILHKKAEVMFNYVSKFKEKILPELRNLGYLSDEN